MESHSWTYFAVLTDQLWTRGWTRVYQKVPSSQHGFKSDSFLIFFFNCNSVSPGGHWSSREAFLVHRRGPWFSSSRKRRVDVLSPFLTLWHCDGLVKRSFSKHIFFVKFPHGCPSEASVSSLMFMSDPANLSRNPLLMLLWGLLPAHSHECEKRTERTIHALVAHCTKCFTGKQRRMSYSSTVKVPQRGCL